MKLKLLFICTANISRSRTAEDLFAGRDDYEVQSAGFKQYSRTGQLVTQDLIDWADRIFVMDENNDHHLSQLREKFDIFDKDIYVLGIPDVYDRGDASLIAILKDKLRGIGGIEINRAS